MSYIQPLSKVCHALPCLTNIDAAAPIDRLLVAVHEMIAETGAAWDVVVHKDYLGEPTLMIETAPGTEHGATCVISVAQAGRFAFGVLTGDDYRTVGRDLVAADVIGLLVLLGGALAP